MAQEKVNFKKRKAHSPASKTTTSSNKKQDEGSSKSQKRALKQERQSHRKHAEAVIEAKKIWNKLRLKANTKEEVREMTKELMDLMRGKVHEIALQHDAARVVQAALQFGTKEERKEVMEELCEASLFELSKNQYAHFVVLKGIKCCAGIPDAVKMIVKSFKGYIPKLSVHATGSKVVEALFSTFPPKSTAILKQEFYGPHFALFAADVVNQESTTASGVPDLASHLKKSPDKKEVTLHFVRGILNKGIDKSLFGYTFFQELFAEYVANCSPNDIRDIAPSVVDHSIHLLSCKAGTRVVAACAAYGTPKNRKQIMRSLKGFTRSALLHRDAYLAVLRLVQLNDDTVSTHKNIFNELLSAPDTEEESTKPPLLEIALDDRASKLFLMLLVSEDSLSWKKMFDPYELPLMDPNPTVVEGGKEVPTSRKDPVQKREELMQHLRKPLIEICTEHTRELLLSMSGSAVIREVYNSLHPDGLVEAIVDVCVSEMNGEADEGDASLFEDRVGHLAMKNLILCDVEGSDDSGRDSLAKEFFIKMEDHLLDVAKSNRGAFVLAAMCKVPDTRDDAVKYLKKKTKVVKKLSDSSKASAGYEALLKEIEG